MAFYLRKIYNSSLSQQLIDTILKLLSNGETWYKLRKVFQKGLSSPVAVQHFIKPSDDVIQEWFERLDHIHSKKPQPKNYDYLPELARLFLESKFI